MNEAGPSLTIVVPALNEEAAIGSTIKRTLAARQLILAQTSVQQVRVVVVSDGSTDRTVEIARRYEDIELVVFPKNRGYGAAIKEGWSRAPSDLLAFLDADGTCDPTFFVPMCRLALEQHHDVVLGGRMAPGSRMPLVRRAGNVLFALLLGYLSRKVVYDTASGMRVVRRVALPKLLPLPDGLHFTPAMSARALMEDDLSLAEVDIPYAERVGRSKLRIFRDGFRFLAVILSAASYVRVSRITLPLVAVLVTVSTALMLPLVLFYTEHRRLEDWMIYRFLFSGMLGTMAVIVLCATIVSEHVCALTLRRYHRFGVRARGLWRYETLKTLVGIATILGAAGVALNWAGVVELLAVGHLSLHWSRVLLGAFLGINFTLASAMLCTLKIIRALHQRQPFVAEIEGADPP